MEPRTDIYVSCVGSRWLASASCEGTQPKQYAVYPCAVLQDQGSGGTLTITLKDQAAERALKKGMSVWNMRVVQGAPQAAQRDGSSMTSSGAT